VLNFIEALHIVDCLHAFPV